MSLKYTDTPCDWITDEENEGELEGAGKGRDGDSLTSHRLIMDTAKQRMPQNFGPPLGNSAPPQQAYNGQKKQPLQQACNGQESPPPPSLPAWLSGALRSTRKMHLARPSRADSETRDPPAAADPLSAQAMPAPGRAPRPSPSPQAPHLPPFPITENCRVSNAPPLSADGPSDSILVTDSEPSGQPEGLG